MMCWRLIKFTKCQDATLGAGHGARDIPEKVTRCDIRVMFSPDWMGDKIEIKYLTPLSRLGWEEETVYKSLYYSPIKTKIYSLKCSLFKHFWLWQELKEYSIVSFSNI